MKIANLKRGQLFRTGRQINFRTFLEASEHNGKLLVYYDNCKEMICEKDTVCQTAQREKVQGFSNYYSTGLEKREVVINGFKTNISYLLKDGNKSIFLYTIKNKKGSYVFLDVREIKDFPDYDYKVMMDKGLDILEKHVKEFPLAYNHLISDIN